MMREKLRRPETSYGWADALHRHLAHDAGRKFGLIECARKGQCVHNRAVPETLAAYSRVLARVVAGKKDRCAPMIPSFGGARPAKNLTFRLELRRSGFGNACHGTGDNA
jgi:hypothetical protein